MDDITRGGQFLVKETKCENVFTPEDFSEEQIMMRDSVKEFVDKEIWPNKDRFEIKKPGSYILKVIANKKEETFRFIVN